MRGTDSGTTDGQRRAHKGSETPASGDEQRDQQEGTRRRQDPEPSARSLTSAPAGRPDRAAGTSPAHEARLKNSAHSTQRLAVVTGGCISARVRPEGLLARAGAPGPPSRSARATALSTPRRGALATARQVPESRPIKDDKCIDTGTTSSFVFARPPGEGKVPTQPLMILPQVHLRKPCYDFYFL